MDSSYAARAESRDISLKKSTKEAKQLMLYFMQYDILLTILIISLHPFKFSLVTSQAYSISSRKP